MAMLATATRCAPVSWLSRKVLPVLYRPSTPTTAASRPAKGSQSCMLVGVTPGVALLAAASPSPAAGTAGGRGSATAAAAAAARAAARAPPSAAPPPPPGDAPSGEALLPSASLPALSRSPRSPRSEPGLAVARLRMRELESRMVHPPCSTSETACTSKTASYLLTVRGFGVGVGRKGRASERQRVEG